MNKHIKNFNENLNNDKVVKKVNYIDTMSLEDILPKATQKLMKENSHNNGWCMRFYVESEQFSKDEYSWDFQEINSFFLSQGIKAGDIVYIHYDW